VEKTQHIDTELLESAIQKSGLRPGFLAENLGLTRQGFHQKRKGTVPFRQSEVYVLCDLLRLDQTEKVKIFFPDLSADTQGNTERETKT
jgi:hypothetical protein